MVDPSKRPREKQNDGNDFQQQQPHGEPQRPGLARSLQSGPAKCLVNNPSDDNVGIGIDKKGQIHIDLDSIRQLGPRVKVKVKEGDTLEELLMAQGYSRHEIYDKGILDRVARESKLKDPNHLPVGTEFSLPTKLTKVQGNPGDPKPKPVPAKTPWWEKGNEM